MSTASVERGGMVAVDDMRKALIGYHAALAPQHLATPKEHKRRQGDDVILAHKVETGATGSIYAHKRDHIAHGKDNTIKGAIDGSASTAPRGIEVNKDEVVGSYKVVEIG